MIHWGWQPQWVWHPQVGQTWRSRFLEADYLLLEGRGQDSNYFHFVGLNLENGKTYDVNILNAPTHAWERLA